MRMLMLLVALSAPLFGHAESGKETLRRLYPEFTPEMIRQKVNNSPSELKFLRSLVAVFYDYLARDGARLPIMQQMKAHGGWCMGDAHLENFGALLMANGEPTFTINDLDDSGPCPLAADFLRFLVAAKMTGYKDADLQDFVSEYVETLEKGSMNYSSPVEILLATAKNDGQRPKKSMLNGDKLIREAELEGLKELSSEELRNLSATVGASDAKSKLLDGFSFKRSTGGSSGTKRYRILALLPPKLAGTADGKVVLEFKQLQRAGIFPLASAALPKHAVRITRSLRVAQGKEASSLYQAVEYSGQHFLMRPLWKGNTGVELSDFPKDVRIKIVKDEVQTLALIHKRGADDSNTYLRAIKSVSPAQWQEAVNASEGYMTRLFKELHD